MSTPSNVESQGGTMKNVSDTHGSSSGTGGSSGQSGTSGQSQHINLGQGQQHTGGSSGQQGSSSGSGSDAHKHDDKCGSSCKK
ncbi:unnamed protein product [Didymodactylos carnosus]|uniref:Uncharacterized protein n=1 Tax=Didymodactylos carnosus TaxID=1234261 RepID=A0A815L5Q7_9BILA|nr:unnamed protein product [Didymodactylos carnosus]CAF4293834.1 unnamed protein product [Didymodactylos carnosus]